MNSGILIVAHAPLASALRAAVLHVFPDVENGVLALDVPAFEDPGITIAAARELLANSQAKTTLVMTDVFGATPCNIAQKIVDGVNTKLVAGVNLPMLLRTVNYRHEPLDVLAARALAGGTQSIMQVAITAPQNQQRKTNDLQDRDHSQ
jgi:PTS system ascorbate-specific IIA component